jgi:hypothetical protein
MILGKDYTSGEKWLERTPAGELRTNGFQSAAFPPKPDALLVSRINFQAAFILSMRKMAPLWK